MKIGILTYDNGDYSVYVAFFDDPVRLATAVSALNAERRDLDSGEMATAETHVVELESVPSTIDDTFLDRLAGFLSEAGSEIERSEERNQRLAQEAADRTEEEEEARAKAAEPVVPSPGQLELGE